MAAKRCRNFASRAAGCRYFEAHSLLAAGISGVGRAKIEQVWEYRTSPLYSEAERAALDFALAAGADHTGSGRSSSTGGRRASA